MPLIENKDKRKFLINKSEGQQYYNNFFRNKTKASFDPIQTDLSKILQSLDMH